jgi:hypothetical protein
VVVLVLVLVLVLVVSLVELSDTATATASAAAETPTTATVVPVAKPGAAPPATFAAIALPPASNSTVAKAMIFFILCSSFYLLGFRFGSLSLIGFRSQSQTKNLTSG